MLLGAQEAACCHCCRTVQPAKPLLHLADMEQGHQQAHCASCLHVMSPVQACLHAVGLLQPLCLALVPAQIGYWQTGHPGHLVAAMPSLHDL